MNLVLCNGEPAEAGGPGARAAQVLRALALRNDGHFTTMQVRGRAVRGLDLHLRRLREATRELFDAELDDTRVRGDLRAALDLAGVDDCTARVSVAASGFDGGDPRRPAGAVGVDLVVAITAPAGPDPAPLRAKSFRYERVLPHVKHAGTFPLFHFARQARAAGFDDALFVDADGRVGEGSVWNLGFWDGAAVTWPQAPALRGTCERLLQAGLAALGVAQAARTVGLAELGGFRGAFACNSRGVRPIGAIDAFDFVPEPGLMQLLARALDTQPRQPV